MSVSTHGCQIDMFKFEDDYYNGWMLSVMIIMVKHSLLFWHQIHMMEQPY